MTTTTIRIVNQMNAYDAGQCSHTHFRSATLGSSETFAERLAWRCSRVGILAVARPALAPGPQIPPLQRKARIAPAKTRKAVFSNWNLFLSKLLRCFILFLWLARMWIWSILMRQLYTFVCLILCWVIVRMPIFHMCELFKHCSVQFEVLHIGTCCFCGVAQFDLSHGDCSKKAVFTFVVNKCAFGINKKS